MAMERKRSKIQRLKLTQSAPTRRAPKLSPTTTSPRPQVSQSSPRQLTPRRVKSVSSKNLRGAQNEGEPPSVITNNPRKSHSSKSGSIVNLSPFPQCSPAWEAFSEHVRHINASASASSTPEVRGEQKLAYASLMSETHASALRYIKMKQQAQRRFRNVAQTSQSETRGMVDTNAQDGSLSVGYLRQNTILSATPGPSTTTSFSFDHLVPANTPTRGTTPTIPENEGGINAETLYVTESYDHEAYDEVDFFDDEEDKEMSAKRRREAAVAHWAIVKRWVDDQRRERRAKEAESDQSWLVLRAQLRALTRAAKVKEDLYVRYGVVPERGKRVAVNMMSCRSSGGAEEERIRDIVQKFQSLKITRMPPLNI